MSHQRSRITLLWTICLVSVSCVFSQSNPFQLSNPTDCGLSFSINDRDCDNPQQFSLNVTTAPGTALGTDVFLEKVKLLISHEWLADVELRLISPSGKMVELIDEVGSGNQNFGDPDAPNCSVVTTLVAHVTDINCGVEKITDASWPYTGDYLPLENFSHLNDGSSPLGNWVVEECDDALSDTGSIQFVELVFSPSNCIQPTEIQMVTSDSSNATLTWVPGALDCSNTIIEFGLPGFSPGSGTSAGEGTVVNVGCPPAVIPGLEPSTDYEVYIRQNCGGGNISLNSCPVIISTTCSPPPISWLETFNSEDLCQPFCGIPCKLNGIWTNSRIDDEGFDWIVNKDSTSTSGTGPSGGFPTGGKYLYIDYSALGCRKGKFASLISTCMDILARPDTCDFSFDYHMFGAHVQSLTLQVTEDGGMNWTDLWSASGDMGNFWRRAYIDLDAYNGQTVQFRFLGEGGSQKKGDIAIDNPTFYGSIPSSNLTYTYYADEDGDGYGGQAVFYQTCQPNNLPGFVPDNSDCDDSLPFVNPGMSEVPCDGFDLNCDPSDENDLPLLIVESDTVCNGEIGFVSTQPTQFDGEIHWYATASDTMELATGNSYSPPNFPQNLGTMPLVLTFFAEETSNDSCRSTFRIPGQIVILPQPQISTLDTPAVCMGESYNLSTIDVIDAAGANGLISYHNALPPDASNEIDPLIFPTGIESYFIASTSAGGCVDAVEVNFEIKLTPAADIGGNHFICFNADSAQLVANDLGNGVPPVQIDWNINSTQPNVYIYPNAQSGIFDNYTLTLTGANGCASSDTLPVLTVLSSLDPVSVASVPVSMCQGNDGMINLSPQNGQPPFNYFWEGNGQNGSALGEPGSYSINGLTQGAYSITITDSAPGSCPFILPIQAVDGPGAILTSSQITPVSCNGGSDGCIEINVVGNAPSILWETGDTTEQVCGLIAGSYSVTLTDGTCQSELTFQVAEPDKLVVSTSINEVSCHGGNDGRIELNVFNGNGGYQFNWAHGPMTSIIQNLSAGNFAVTVNDSKGCFIELPNITVGEPDPIDFQMDMLGEPTCFGGNDGQIIITPTGGTSPYDVDWSNGGMGTTINSLATGSYGVSIEDARGCDFSGQINLGQPLPIQASLDHLAAPQCNGIDDGTIEITPTGGAGGYSFEWNNGLMSEDLIGILPPGDFWVTVTDAEGCTGTSETYTLAENPFVQLSIFSQNPACVGAENGTISANVIAGGTPPFDYLWSTNEMGQAISGLPVGDYTLTITDGAGCQLDSTFTLSSPQVLDVDWITTDPSCFAMPTGQITLNVAGGTQPYFYEWNNAETENTVDSLLAGSYVATVTDAAGCQFITPTILLREASPFFVGTANVEGVTCFGDEDGSAGVNIGGGAPPYAILWSNGATSPTVTGLAPGTYQVSVTDANSCVIDTVSIEITAPPALDAETVAASLGCISFSTDTLCVNVNGGDAPFDFAWSDGTMASCLTNAPIGDYSLTITDASGCTHEMMNIKVTEDIDLLTLYENIGQDSICAGEASGEVSVAVEGGVAPFQFIWNNGELGNSNDSLFALSGLSGGGYQVTITDNVGCTKVSSMLEIAEADSIKINAPGSAQTPVNCFDGADGAIDITVSGGFLPLQFLWSDEMGTPLGTTEDLDGLAAGEYFVSVTDANGCAGESSVLVSQPGQPLGFGLSGVNIFDETCFDDEDGRITASAAGGTAPYYFIWSTGDTTLGPTIDELAPGDYFVTIVDANDCAYFSNAISVLGADAPLALTDFALEHASCFGENDASIDITMAGGFGDLSYSWLPASDDEDLLEITAGEYDLTVFDEHFCQFDTFFEIFQPDEILIAYQVEPAFDGDDGVITAQATGGMTPYIYMLSTGQTGDTITGLLPGWYELTVTDASLCENSVWIEVPGITSAGDVSQKISLSLYPNPTTGAAQLKFTAAEAHAFDLRVFDAFGKLVLEKNAPAAREIHLPIELSGVPPGLYFVAGMEDGALLFSEKLIVVEN